MELFYVDQAVDQTFSHPDGSTTRLILDPVHRDMIENGNIPASLIQCSTAACVTSINKFLKVDKKLNVNIQVFNREIKSRAISMPNFPIVITNYDMTETNTINNKPGKIPSTEFIDVLERAKPLIDSGKRNIRLAIINGMGTGIGDSIIGVRALNILYTRLMMVFDSVHIDLFQTPFNTSLTKRQVYDQEKIVKSVNGLPVSLEQVLTYDLLADFSSMVNRENFDTQSMMDFYLESLGVPVESVGEDQRRIFVKRNEFIRDQNKFIFDTMRGPKGKILLIQPNASVAIRSMPGDFFEKLIKYALKHTDHNILFMEHPRYTDGFDFNKLKNRIGKDATRLFYIPDLGHGFDNYANTIAESAAMITVDTCSYHIADSFAVPTVVLFSTIDPDLRTSDYPYVEGMAIRKTNNKLLGTHVSYKPEDIKLSQSYWSKVEISEVFDRLQSVIDRRSSIARIECPVCGTHNEDVATDRYLFYRLITCTSCETEFSIPRKAADYNKLYASVGDDFNYQHYVAEGSRSEVINRYMNVLRFQDIKRYLALSPNKGTLLDVGCANGFLPAFAEDLGFTGYGIDSSIQAIEFAAKNMNLNGRVAVCSNIDELPDSLPQTYDVITSFELVEHLEDPVAFANSVFRRLNPGGVWIFSTPNRNRIQFKMGVKNTGKHRGHDTGDYPSEHLSRFTDLSHRVLAERAGFSVFFQNTSTLSAASAADYNGGFPNFSIKNQDGSVIPVDGNVVGGVAMNYFQHMLSSTENYGNFLVTFARRDH